MPHLPFQIDYMFTAAGIRRQLLQAVDALAAELEKAGQPDARGKAYISCLSWQRRFDQALRSEIPAWTGLAAFRCITDFNLPDGDVDTLFPAVSDETTDLNTNRLNTLAACREAYRRYFDGKEDLHAGKFTLKGDAEKQVLALLSELDPVPGGQAGNILWLWRCIGARAVAYVPYLSEELARLGERFPKKLADLEVVQLEAGALHRRSLGTARALHHTGVRQADGSRVSAPSGGALVMFKDGRRLIFQLDGMRDLSMPAAGRRPWDNVQYHFEEEQEPAKPLHRPGDGITWPRNSLFCECHINEDRTLVVRVLRDEEIRQAFGEQVDFAVLGGLNDLFRDPWTTDETLRRRLMDTAERQLKALSSCDVRLGVELSGFPEGAYLHFLQRMCRDGVIAALGINGIDELPDVTGAKMIQQHHLDDFHLDPETLHADLHEAAADSQREAPREYLTYLRARKLAEATGVRSLYVHTTTLDFILRRDTDPGALVHAQLGDMMGKGLVIAALLQRAYGDAWYKAGLDKMTPAVNPKAMERLGRFAADFERFEPAPGAGARLLHSGYWIASGQEHYSVAVVPVMWPSTDEIPINPTGSGDMTFGAFFFLGGV